MSQDRESVMADFILKEMGRRRQPVSRAAVFGFGLAVLSAALAVSAGLGHRLGWWDFGTGFQVLRWAFYGAVFSVGVTLVGVGRTWMHRRERGFSWAIIGLTVSLLVVLFPLGWLHIAGDFPAIHDVTTDTDHPPAFVAIAPLRKGAANPAEYGGPEVAEQQRQSYPDIGPLVLPASPDRAFRLALAAVRDMGWQLVAAEPKEGRIEATATTFWFGFKDDVVVRVQSDGEAARVDVRSASRVGHSDIGTNARRIRVFMQALQARAGLADAAERNSPKIRPVSTGKYNM